MSMTALVKQLEDKGRNGDSILAHINPEEAQLLKEHGGSGTINPETGLMEFNILSDLWNGFKSVVKQYAPVIIPAIAIFYPPLIPMIGTYLGASGAAAGIVGAAALSAGVTLASGGSLKDVLTSAALAGAGAYMSPILGKTLTTAGAGAVTQAVVGSAATSAGYVALRGGTVKEMMAAAATGAASAYLGNVAREGVAKMNNMMASGTSNTITQKGATDATFAAADAANLKAAGLTESQIAQTLKATGVPSAQADYAAAKISSGMDASTLAANLAANSTTGLYSGEANTKSITAGNNSELVQRIEDANFVAADAAQLKAQGLSQADIVKNLVASGVDVNTANYVASNAMNGLNETQLADKLVNSSGFAKTGKVYTGTDVAQREIGEVMTAEQQNRVAAQPFKTQVDAGTLTVDEAAVLGRQGVTPTELDNLTKLGYTANDVSDMIGAGTDVKTLTNLANTKFTETQIATMLSSGVSANDISNASVAVNNYKNLTTDEAASLLTQGKTGTQIMGLASNNKLPSQVAAQAPVAPTQTQEQQIASSGFSETDAKVLTTAGYTANDVKSLTTAGYTSTDLVEMASAGIPASTLTQLATTPIPEAKINDLLMGGASANDIAAASQFVKSGQLTVDQAATLINKDYTSYDIQRVAVNGNAKSTVAGLDAGLSRETIANLQNTGVDVVKMADYIDKGFINAETINNLPADSTFRNSANSQLSTAEQALQAKTQADLKTQQLAQEQAQQQENLKQLKPIGNGLYLNANGQVVQPMGNYNSLIAESYDQYLASQPKVFTPNTEIGGLYMEDLGNGRYLDSVGNIHDVNGNIIEFPDGTVPQQTAQPSIPSTAVPTVDANGNQGYYDTATGQTLDSNGQVIAQQTTPTGPSVQEAALSPNNQANVTQAQNDYFSGKSSWEDASARINNAVQSDIDSGYLKPQGDGSYISPDGVRYFVNSETGMWDTDAGVQGQNGSGQPTAPVQPEQPPVPLQPTQPEVVQPAQPEVVQPTQPVTPAEPVTDYSKQALQFAGSHGLKTTQIPDVTKAFENGYTEQQLDTAFRQNPYGNWVGQFTQPTQPVTPPVVQPPEVQPPEVAPLPPTTMPVVPELPPGVVIGKPIGGGPVSPEAPTIPPELINAGPNLPTQPTTPTGPTTPTVVSSSQYTGMDGSVYQQNTMSDGTTNTTLVSGPTQPVGPATPPEVVDSNPPTQVPESGSTIKAEELPGDQPTPPVEPPVDPTSPYYPILTPPVEPPTVPTLHGRASFGAIPEINIPQGLNPGFITNVPDFYKTTNPAQSKYYWGAHPFQSGSTFNPTLYNQVPNAPATPFGLGYAQGPASGQQIINAMSGVYPFNTNVAGPVRP